MKNLDNIKELASHCLNCKNKPCSKACPLNNDIPTFINFIKQEKFREAYKVLSKTTILPSICGRICPFSKQCEGNCIRGIKQTPISIGELETFIGDIALKENYAFSLPTISYKEKIAIVGGGPSGLSCAIYLAQKGFNVTIFEKREKLGGLLQYGIPNFRLDKNIVDKIITNFNTLNITIKTNYCLGTNLTFTDLTDNFDAIYLSIGANTSRDLNIPNEHLEGVYSANKILEYNTHPNYKNKEVAIIGGGNVAIDSARTINKLGAKKVYIIYRRSEKEMPAENSEIEIAKSEGIEFIYQTNIINIIGNNKVEQIECIKTKLISNSNVDKPFPVNIDNTNYVINIDYVISAIGSQIDNQCVNNLELNSSGYIKVNENYMTSCNKIFAGGDLIGTKATVAWASKTGIEAAHSIENWLLHI